MKRIKFPLFSSFISIFVISIVAATAFYSMSTLTAANSGRFIVVFKKWVHNPKGKADELAGRHGLTLGHIYKSAIKGFVATVPRQKLADLRLDSDVKYVVPDSRAFLILPTADYSGFGRGGKPGKGGGKPKPQQPPQVISTGLDRINGELNSVASINGVDQRVDVDVAILDTGIDSGHVDLNVAGGVNFSTGNPRKFADGHGHGTHVGGTIGALDNTIGVVGVAPGANLWGVRVLDNNGMGFVSDIIAGVDWVTQRASDIDVVNMSLGWRESDPLNSPTRDAIQASVAKGVVYVVAAGNDNDLASNHSPAAYPEVITVSAIADSDGFPGGVGPDIFYGKDGKDDTLATFSNYGQAVDIAAPGVEILSTLPGDQYGEMSGTSMACPHVTGVAALRIVLSGKPLNAVAVANIKQTLINTGIPQADILAGGFTGDKDLFPEPLVNGLF